MESIHDKSGLARRSFARLQQLVVEYGLAGKPIEMIFDLFDNDEGRDPIAERPWLRVYAVAMSKEVRVLESLIRPS